MRDFNLWVRDIAEGRETPLTTDGVKDFAYGTNNAGWTQSDRPILLWSPDSKKIATFQHDGRKVGEMYLVSTAAGHPELKAWKYPLPGDEHIFTLHRVVVDADAAKVVRFKMDPDPHRSTLCDHITCRGGSDWPDVQWSPDSAQVAFVSTSRDHRHEQLRVADASSGAVRNVLDETVETFFESGNGRVNWRVLFPSNEVIWFSERDNWGQLYLYDLQTGKLKQQITTGEGNVTQLLRVDEKDRVLIFQGAGREKGRDPYFTHLYRVGMDGRNAALLTPEDATHEITLADSGRYFVDSYSKPDVAPVTVLRDGDGKLVLTLENADVSKLVATGWKPPMRIVMKARDGQTDLYGLMYRPSSLDTSKKYPIINQIYPGPQTGSVGSRTFSPARGDTQALAELGFIVVQVERPAREDSSWRIQLRQSGEPELREEPQGQASARAWDDGRECAGEHHAAGRRRPDQGEQGLRPVADPECGARLRRRRQLHDAPPVGLFRQAPAGRGAAEGVRAEAPRGSRVVGSVRPWLDLPG